jgi:chorismate synthase
MANTFGNRLKMTSFGESHGAALGVLIDGCPSGLVFDMELLQSDLMRRRPGQSSQVSQRQEPDLPEVLSGIFENKTLGTPIAIMVRNKDSNSSEYDLIKNNPRNGHADDVWLEKFGHADHRGGGRTSGRETLSRVIGGSIAKMILKKSCPTFEAVSYVSQIGSLKLVEKQDQETKGNVDSLLAKARQDGESYGGEVTVKLKNVPASLGQPVFHKLKADFASAVMSIGATSSFEIGAGIEAKSARGTQFHSSSDFSNSNFGNNSGKYGGIRGGISTGEEIVVRVGFKPTSSILDVSKKGRHDPCIAIRAACVVEAMLCFVLADHLLWKRTDQI